MFKHFNGHDRLGDAQYGALRIRDPLDLNTDANDYSTRNHGNLRFGRLVGDLEIAHLPAGCLPQVEWEVRYAGEVRP
jgi:hypothetical protein